jgi:acyl-CoA thioesterase I
MAFLVGLLASGCGVFAEASTEQKPMKVAALGTSLTHNGGWLKPLEHQLSGCLEQSVDVIDFGRNGATSDWGIEILDEVIHAQPDVVLIEFSVNDAAWFKGISLRQSRENVQRIVRTLKKAQPHVKIFLMTMSPSFGPRAWIRPQIDAYHHVYRVLADELGVGYIDNLPTWQNLTKRELRAQIPDGLHPMPEWAGRIVVPAIAGAIAGTKCVETTVRR